MTRPEQTPEQIRQDRDAQFAHNTALVERIKELEEDNDFQTRYMIAIQKELGDPQPPEGHLTYNLVERVRELRATVEAQKRPRHEEVTVGLNGHGQVVGVWADDAEAVANTAYRVRCTVHQPKAEAQPLPAHSDELLSDDGRCSVGHSARLTYMLDGTSGCVACDRDRERQRADKAEAALEDAEHERVQMPTKKIKVHPPVTCSGADCPICAREAEIARLTQELEREKQAHKDDLQQIRWTQLKDHPHGTDCPTYYDGCNCTVENLLHNIERAEKAEAEIARLRSALQDYGQHRDGCGLGRVVDGVVCHDCTCGFRGALLGAPALAGGQAPPQRLAQGALDQQKEDQS